MLKIKHFAEWPLLIKISKDHSLDPEQIIILLALREFKDGPEGFEFKELGVIERGLVNQATITAKYIRTVESSFQSYIRRNEENNYSKDLLEYITGLDAYPVSRYMKLIIEEFNKSNKETTNDPNATTRSMGKEDRI